MNRGGEDPRVPEWRGSSVDENGPGRQPARDERRFAPGRSQPPRSNGLVLIARETATDVRTTLLAEAQRRVNILEAPADLDLHAVDASVSVCRADSIGACGPAFMQATVAAVASGLGLPFACVRSGPDDAFARDLGVPEDRPDLVLNDLMYAGRRYVDLAEVNGIVFVNYVRFELETASAGPDGFEARLRTVGEDGPSPGESRPARARAGPTLLVTNNRFTFEDHGPGFRARLDAGQLGVLLIGRSPPDRDDGRPPTLHESTCRQLELPADGPVLAEVDGRERILSPPVRLRTIPAALRTIASDHDGSPPSPPSGDAESAAAHDPQS